MSRSAYYKYKDHVELVTGAVKERSITYFIMMQNDFSLLKESLNLSWDVISSLAKSGTTKIKEWYEIFSGK